MFTMTACGNESMLPEAKHVIFPSYSAYVELNSYKASFLEECKRVSHSPSKQCGEAMENALKRLKIRFTTLNDHKDADKGTVILGTCGYTLNEIYIYWPSWETMGEARRESLMFHEMGHCILNIQGHSEASHGADVSIMNTSIINETHYKLERDRMLTLLFNERR